MKTNIRIFFSIAAIVLLSDLTASVKAQNCQTPSFTSGFCLPYKNCENYTQYLRTQHNTDQLKSFIQQSHCNQDDTENIHICCDECYVTASSFYGVPEYTYISNLDSRGFNVLSSLKDCGKSSNYHLSFGEETRVGEYPWMALIEYNTPDQPFQCGGSLISSRYVLTAAHCLEVSNIRNITGVILGEHNLDRDPDCTRKRRRTYCMPPRERFDIDKIIPHPEYRKSFISHDIGLIKLKTSVEFKQHISPICLPLTPFSLKIQETYIISGWGTTETGRSSRVLMKAIVPYKDNEVCRKLFRRISDSINQQHLCVGGDGPFDTCKGDSGGPLFTAAIYLPLTPRFIQYGIVSYGGMTCSSLEKNPGLYTNVTEYMPWITSNLEE